MEFKQFFSAIKHWFWWLALGALLGAGLGFFISNQQTPIYEASTRFLVMRAAQTTNDYYSYLDSTQLIDTYAQLLTTEDTLNQASMELGYPVTKGQASTNKIPDTQFIELSVKDADPVKAAEIANVLVNILIDQNEKLQAVRYDTAEKNLQDRIDQSQQQISALETQISDLSIIAVSDQISKVQSEIKDTQAQINYLKQEMKGIDPYSANEADQTKLADYQAQLDELTPILSLYQQIYTNLVVLGTSGNENQKTTTTSQIDQLNTTLNLYQQIYLSSISSLETLRLAKAQNTPNVVQVEIAVPPKSAISPRPLLTAAIAAAVGLVLAVLIVFLIEYFDDTLKTPDEVKNILGLPVIGFIAEVRKNSKTRDDEIGVYVAQQARSPIAEAFRSLRTNLEYSSVDTPLKVLLVTSSGETEGKSSIVSNLAIAEAQSGKKVLIIDADLRRPNLHTIFNLSNRLGLSDLIAGKHTTGEVIKKVDLVDHLDIITAGNLPPNPAELLGSERMRKILSDLKQTYDFVILDSPPTLVTDAQILSTIADGVIFVLIPGKTSAIAAVRPLDELKNIGARLVGVVMNRIPKNRDYYYGGYNYYSPYRSYGEGHYVSSQQESDHQAT